MTINRYLILFFLLLFPVMQVNAQDERVRLSRQEMTVGEAVIEIENQTNYKFAFDNSTFERSERVKFRGRDLSVREAVNQMLDGTGLSYLLRGRQIAIVGQRDREEPKQSVVWRDNNRYEDTYNRSEVKRAQPTERQASVPVQEVEVKPIDTPVAISHTVPLTMYVDSDLPTLSIKTNLLYGAATLTPNLAMEIGIGKRSTFELSGGWNQWNYRGDKDSNKKLNHFIIRPEYRYWFCERFNGHFVGADLFAGMYNISEYDIPILAMDKQHRYEGHLYGAGVVYGYHLPIAKLWSLEFHAGFGVAAFKYNKYDCVVCSQEYKTEMKTYFGPTRAGISLVFMIR